MKKFNTKSIIFFIALFSTYLQVYSQDIIQKINGDKIECEINIIDLENIKYKKYDNLDGPFYLIKKSEIEKIIFKNGTEESFTNVKTEDKLSLDEIKNLIVKEINEHGYEEDSFKSRYKASFDENYLKLTELSRNSTKETNNVILYDFSNVYKFQKNSKRSDKLVFINIWVSILKNKKKMKFDKHKLIMRVDDPIHADIILDALKKLNEELIKKD